MDAYIIKKDKMIELTKIDGIFLCRDGSMFYYEFDPSYNYNSKKFNGEYHEGRLLTTDDLCDIANDIDALAEVTFSEKLKDSIYKVADEVDKWIS